MTIFAAILEMPRMVCAASRDVSISAAFAPGYFGLEACVDGHSPMFIQLKSNLFEAQVLRVRATANAHEKHVAGKRVCCTTLRRFQPATAGRCPWCTPHKCSYIPSPSKRVGENSTNDSLHIYLAIWPPGCTGNLVVQLKLHALLLQDTLKVLGYFHVDSNASDVSQELHRSYFSTKALPHRALAARGGNNKWPSMQE